jgi:Fic family protein
VDGNGRASRLLSTLCLYRSGYDFKRLFTLSEFYDRDRNAFYAALQGVREHDMDLTGWLDYFVGGLAVQMGEVKARGAAVIRRDLIAREHGLNERQGLVIEHLLQAGRLDIRDYEALRLGVSRRTLQRDLAVLEERGLVRREGETNKLVYLPGARL